MEFTIVWLLVVWYACLSQAAPVNQTQLSLAGTYNVQNLYMNIFLGNTPDGSVKPEEVVPGDVEVKSNDRGHSSRVKLTSNILELLNVLYANGNRTARSFEGLEEEMETNQYTLLQAIRGIPSQLIRNDSAFPPEFTTTTTFNETLRRVQSDLEFLRTSILNMSKTAPETSFPTDCNEVFERRGKHTGVHTVKPEGASSPTKVRCEMGNTPWTVLMRRFNGSVNFKRMWNDYKNGFGNPDSEYWAGNDFIHYLTSQRRYKVRFDMKLWSTGATSYSEFTQFWVGHESTGYKLLINSESGTAKKGGMAQHNGMKFSTKDRDNDKSSRRCAVDYPGGWWYRGCYNVLFTGPYDTSCDSRCSRWYGGTALKEMSIRVSRI